MTALKDFAMRNRATLLQMFLFAVLVIAGFVMLQLSSRPQLPEYKDLGNSSAQNRSSPAPLQFAMEENCTPIFKGTRKISYAYEATSQSSDGLMRMSVSYDYVSVDVLSGSKADVTELSVNATMRNMTFDMSTKFWLDYGSGKCIKAETRIGQSLQPADCRYAMAGIPAINCKEQLAGLNFTSKEEVEVPAGKFNTSVYKSGSDTLWIVEGLPIPAKFISESKGTRVVALLVRYEEKR